MQKANNRMNNARSLILIVSVFFAATTASAQTRQELPEELSSRIVSTPFSMDRTPDGFEFHDHLRSISPSGCTVTTGQDGNPVLDIDLRAAGKSQYQISLHYKTTGSIKAGDVLLLRLTMRTILARQESGESVIYLGLQDQKDGSRMINTIIGSGEEWKTFDIPVKAGRDFAPGEAAIWFFLSSLVQHVQITGLEVLDFGKNATVQELPETKFTYKGREESAGWRKDALARIDEIRTAPVSIQVLDGKGRPVKNASVKLEMTHADFIWGTAVNERYASGTDSISDIYRTRLKELFNAATVENGFKGGGWYWPDDRKVKTIQAFEWLEANGFRQRGHNLVWPGWKFNPLTTRYIAEHESPEVFSRFIKAQMHERMAYTKGRVYGWDVVNEYLHEKDFFPYLRGDPMVEWFKLARELDPDAELYINEYSMLNCVQSPANIREYADTIRALVARGAPIDAIGIQGHVGRQPRDPEMVISDLDLLVPMGMPVQITEFDINTPDEDLQADYLRDFLIAVYSHPVITGVTLWGFWEGAHWKKDAAFYRLDWTPKKADSVWRSLVKGEWFTSRDGKTDRKGRFDTRGHFGDYRLTVSFKGQVKELCFHLGKDNDNITVQL